MKLMIIETNRLRASESMLRVMEVNKSNLNGETQIAILHLSLMIEFGGWGEHVIQRCYQPDAEWGPASQLSIDLMMSYKAFIEEPINEDTEELIQITIARIKRLFEAYDYDEFEIASSVDWHFVGRLFIGAVDILYEKDEPSLLRRA